MATSIDALDIQISAKATSANNAINRLTKNLDKLSTSLNSLNVGNVKGLDKTLKSLANISNVSSNGATNITNLARALATLSANANNIPVLNRSLSGLSGSLARFMTTMSVAPSVNSNTLQMTQTLAQLSRAGNNASATASNLANLGTQLRNFMQIMSTAPMVNQNTIQMTNALANLASQGSRVGRSSQSLVSGLNRTDRAMRTSTKSAWSLARAFGKFYANYFLIIRGAKALWGSIESTADYIEAYNYYNAAFGKIASEWKGYFNEELGKKLGISTAEEYAESFTGRMNETLGKLSGVQISVGADGKGLLTDTGMKNLGLNIQEITQYASQLASVTNSLGQTGETSLAISQSFTKLAGDISSLFNVDYSTVAQNLQSGLIGQSRALYKYGIDITNATLQTYAYKLGLTKAVSEMTQAEKQQLRTIAILDQSKVSWGDLANTINSPSNMIRQLSTNLKEAGMVLGQLFIPMLGHVLPVVNGATIALKRLLTEIAGFFGVEIDFEKFGQGYNELEEDNSDLSGSYDDLANSIEEVKSQLLGFDEVNKLSDTSTTLSVGTEDNTIDLTDEIVSATEEYQKVWDEAFANMESTSSKWADRIEKALSGIGDVFEDFAVGDFFKAGEDVSGLVIDFNNFIAKAIDGIDGEAIGKNFANFMLGIDYSGIAKSLANIVGSIFEIAWDFGWGIGDALSDWLVNNNIENFWDFGKILGGDALSDMLIELEKSIYGDPLKYIDWREEHDKELQDITDRYTALNDQVARYVELSGKYDTLSDEEKGYVKQMGDELKAAGIVENINDITGAWEGTEEQLQATIKQQMNYIKLTASQDYLAELYKEMGKLEQEKAKLYGEQSEISLIGYFKYLFGEDDAEMEGVEAQIDSVANQIAQTQAQIRYFENELAGTSSAKKILTNLGFAAFDWSEDNEELSNYLQYLGDMKNGFDTLSYKASKFGRITSGLSAFKMNTVDFKRAGQEIDVFTEKYSDSEVKAGFSTENIANGLNYASSLINIKMLDWNSLKIRPTLSSNAIMTGMQALQTSYKAQIDGMNSKKVNPQISTTSVMNRINTIKSSYTDSVNKMNALKTIPQINTTAFSAGITSAMSIFNTKMANLTSKVKFVEDEDSLFGLKNRIQKAFENLKLTISVGAGAGALAGLNIKQYAIGGYPDIGQLFIANEAGPELVGNIGSRPAVANSDQITQAIAQSVAPAVYNAVVSAMQTSRGGNSDVVVNIDGKQVFKAVQKQANNYVAQTGQTPFPI